ncbi:MAG: 4Fe-4S binding protein [Deltaproteobacteria bacterium]|nr:4Fe-4S binding protein [Deltaproteobacteria bacterium]MBW2016109.1 4Fe-4S binding protein [Deltaproteobacteria bacterium]MBW2128041.1 4Fe-4S binding protein [Deltaproteobacteria bacterium]MBW2304061.1 4Fe-4S binding protein [Deltaproteobacteria bacterium]
MERRIWGGIYRDYEVYLVFVDSARCDGCEECVKFCPVDVFDMTHKAVLTRPDNCLGCRICEAVCNSKAVIITEITLVLKRILS